MQFTRISVVYVLKINIFVDYYVYSYKKTYVLIGRLLYIPTVDNLDL